MPEAKLTSVHSLRVSQELLEAMLHLKGQQATLYERLLAGVAGMSQATLADTLSAPPEGLAAAQGRAQAIHSLHLLLSDPEHYAKRFGIGAL